MSLYNFQDYKKTLEELLKAHPELNKKELAARVPIQATYLSKFFKDPNSHLKDETLYRICKILGLDDESADYLINLKAWEICENPERKDFLYKKLQVQKDSKLEVIDQSKGMELQTKYFLNPIVIIIHLALQLDRFKKSPRLLCGELNISQSKLLEHLDLLESCEHIARDSDPFAIKEVLTPNFHLSPSNEIMRIHQSLFNILSHSRVQDTGEEDKKCFNASFHMNNEGMMKAKDEFEVFIKKIQKISSSSKSFDGVYQLKFDLFKWL